MNNPKKIRTANQDLESAKLFKIVSMSHQEGSSNIDINVSSLKDIKDHPLILEASQGKIVNSPSFSFESYNPQYLRIEELLKKLEKQIEELRKQDKHIELNKAYTMMNELIEMSTSGRVPKLLKAPISAVHVQEFKHLVKNDAKGVYLQWSFNGDEGIWYIEFIGSKAERINLLGTTPDGDEVDSKDDFDISFILRAVLKKKDFMKVAKVLRRIKAAQRLLKIYSKF